MKIANIDNSEERQVTRGKRVHARRWQLGRSAGGQQLGCSMIEVDAGRDAWPMHFHCVNEEAIFVVSGVGQLRTPSGVQQVQPGDYIAFPVGPDHAHTLHNEGPGPLRYLCISTMHANDIGIYPELGTVNVMAGSPPGGDPSARIFQGIYKIGSEVDYWTGEPKNTAP